MTEREPEVRRDPRLPQLRLDELLDELMSRVQQVRATRDRVQQLLQAVLAVSGGLDLDEVLTTIVKTAIELVEARYGALGVIGGERADRLERFVTVGLTREQIAAIGPYPTGMGLLGEVIRHPVPLRVDVISEHEASFGFPDNHPPMKTFLGVPIRVRDEVYGNLYITEKKDGAVFDADDEALLVTLAAAAGVAIENARLYDDARRRQQWVEATAELTRGLLSGADARDVLTVLIDRIRVVAGADLVYVALPESGDRLVVQVASGVGDKQFSGRVVELDDTLTGQVYRTGAGRAIVDREWSDRPEWGELGLGPAYIAPLGAEKGRVKGIMVVARRSGELPFSSAVVRMISDVAGQAAVALELAERRADTERLALFADRDRIGRDLHDLAIQRLFAAGMTLQSVLKITEKPAVRDRVTTAVADLDDTIKVIRSTIFALSEHDAVERVPSLRAQVLQICQDAAGPLGFAPAVRFTGPVDYEVPDEAVEHCQAVTREALSNVARHARATRVSVDLETANGYLTLRVADNGVGIGDDVTRRSGLGNIADRAETLRGSAALSAGEDGGTVLVWRVPLDEPDAA